MVSVRSVGLALAIGVALTLSSLLIRTPVMRDEDTAGERLGVPSQWVAAPNDDVGEEEASEWIIPEHPRIGLVFLIPFAYDWLFWTLVAATLLAVLSLRRRRNRGQPPRAAPSA